MPPLGAKKLRTAAGGEGQWVDRHKPVHLGQVIGNTDLVRKLAEWLRDWDDVVFRGMTKEQPASEEWRTYKPIVENLSARAALVSGPAGIGKTTTATLVARCNAKYSVMEFNASDARSKTVIESMSTSLAGNHKLNLGSKNTTLQRTVIIMDECDGMTAGDKGGMQALINMIKVTKNPIICICNERNDQHVKNLAPHCLDIKFRRPENVAVAKRVKAIMAGEGKKVELEAVESLVEACGHDIRQVINHVQFFGLAAAGAKDTQVMLSPFDACSRLLSGTQGKDLLPLERRMDMFYIDSDMVPLMIQENYLRPFEKASEEDALEACSKAATLIADADGMGGSFQVSSSAAVMGSIYPAFLAAKTTKEPFQRPGFPTWLMKRGATSKAKQLALDMHSGLKLHTSCSYRDLVTSGYHDVLHRRLLRPLQLGAAKDSAVALYSYGLTREFFTDQAPALRTPLQLDDNYKKLDGKVKHQLLQELQALSQQNAPVKRKREDGSAVPRRKEHIQGDSGGTVAHDGSLEGEETHEDAAAARKRRARKTSKADGNSAAVSLSGWLPKKEVVEGEVPGRKEPMLIFRYLDGHTSAVRRKVRMTDFLGPWTMF